MNILITGGTGFIGKEILKELNSNKNRILVLTRKHLKNKKNIEYLKCDFFSPETYKKEIYKFNPEIAIHCAWYGIPNLNKKNSNLNLKYSKIFINHILKTKNLKQLLVSGSCFEIKKKDGKKSENCNIDLNNYFANAKFEIYKFIKKKVSKNIKFYWLRIFYAYGPNQRKDSLIPHLINSLKKNKKLNLKNPLNSLDFIYVNDVARYFKKIIDVKPNSGIYNVGSGKKIKIKKIFNVLKNLINKKYKFKIINNFLKSTSFFCCNKKTLKNLNFKIKYDIYSGLKKTLRLI